jgi:hypothetical protein
MRNPWVSSAQLPTPTNMRIEHVDTIREHEAQIRASELRVSIQRQAVDRATGEEKRKEQSRLQLLETELKNLKSSLAEVKSRAK